MTSKGDYLKDNSRNVITTQSYHLRKLCELIITHIELNKDLGEYDYLKIPVTKDEWRLILKRLKDY